MSKDAHDTDEWPPQNEVAGRERKGGRTNIAAVPFSVEENLYDAMTCICFLFYYPAPGIKSELLGCLGRGMRARGA